MKKRILSAVMLLALLLAISPRASAAVGQEKVFTEDTVWREYGYFIAYDSVTVRAGVTVTVDKDFGFEIMDRLTVEPGGRFICSGEGSVQFNFAMKHRGSEVIGVPLYYQQSWGDGSVTYELIPEPFVDTWTDSFAWEEMNPQVKWVEAAGDGGGWCVIWPMAGNPFNSDFFHGGCYMSVAEQSAMLLRSHKLFLGTGDVDGVPNFELGRPAKRAEALVMLLRLLGKYDEADAGGCENPFSDKCWADRFIGYAYEQGLTNGYPDGTFRWNEPVTAQQYMTFLLRALGYPENGGKLYQNALDTAEGHGLYFIDGYPFRIQVGKDFEFWRADMVLSSLKALKSQCFGSPDERIVLADKLGITL